MEQRPHNLLPADAVSRLMKASKTKNTPADPMAREKAIERAHQWVRETYPHLFRIDD